MRWFGRFRNSQDVLTPGTCEFEHSRCSHVDGRGRCTAEYTPDAEWPHGAACSCRIFILDKDNGGGDDAPEPPTSPAVKELEKIYKSRCS